MSHIFLVYERQRSGDATLTSLSLPYLMTRCFLVWWAGGVIAGKAVCEDLCCSGSSFATALGPVRNPYNEDYAAGGSSSGCAALVRRLTNIYLYVWRHG